LTLLGIPFLRYAMLGRIRAIDRESLRQALESSPRGPMNAE